MCDPIAVGDSRFPVRVIVEQRKNVRVSIGKTAVYIRIPRALPEGLRQKHIRRCREWAQDSMTRDRNAFLAVSPRVYTDGDTLKVGNRTYRIRIHTKEKKTSSAQLRDGTIYLSMSSRLHPDRRAKCTAALVSRSVAKMHLPKLCKRIGELNERHFHGNLNRVRLKLNTSNWGSCSTRGNINISTRVLFAPEAVIDYVCIHELAHLIERNHSRRFWDLVGGAMPDYRKCKKWLRENDTACRF